MSVEYKEQARKVNGMLCIYVHTSHEPQLDQRCSCVVVRKVTRMWRTNSSLLQTGWFMIHASGQQQLQYNRMPHLMIPNYKQQCCPGLQLVLLR